MTVDWAMLSAQSPASFAHESNPAAVQSESCLQATPLVSLSWADPQVYNGNPHPASGSVTGVSGS